MKERVLIMTSNSPSKLDDALIRPGRIDWTIGFTMATRFQIREIFIRMYSPDTPAGVTRKNGLSQALSIPTSDLADRSSECPTDGNGPLVNINVPPTQSNPFPTSLEQSADDFAASFEDGTFTPAEIQGFLLKWKNDPTEALAEGPAWKAQQLRDKQERNTRKNTAQ